MVEEIRIYVEGGGDSRDTKAFFRQGLSVFLDSLKSEARQRRIRWSIIPCGPRQRAFEDFELARKTHTSAFNVLLVDSEAAVQSSASRHLANHDGWNLASLSEDQCYLMVQAMEAWLISDVESLARFYGAGFNRNPLPNAANIENIEKMVLNNALKEATRSTAKGEYHKTRHGYKLLEAIDPAAVRKVCGHCDRLFETIANRIRGD